MQAPENAQRLLVVSNYVFCDAGHHVGKSSVILISPGTDFRRSGTPTGRTYDIQDVPQQDQVDAVNRGIRLFIAPGRIIGQLAKGFSKRSERSRPYSFA